MIGNASSTGSGSTWRPRWPASCTTSTAVGIFSIFWCNKHPVVSHRFRSPSHGCRRRWLPGWVNFPAIRRNGTASTAITCATMRRAGHPRRIRLPDQCRTPTLHWPPAQCQYHFRHCPRRSHSTSLYNIVRGHGENNRDGESYNRSWNCGVEGPTSMTSTWCAGTRQMRKYVG